MFDDNDPFASLGGGILIVALHGFYDRASSLLAKGEHGLRSKTLPKLSGWSQSMYMLATISHGYLQPVPMIIIETANLRLYTPPEHVKRPNGKKAKGLKHLPPPIPNPAISRRHKMARKSY